MSQTPSPFQPGMTVKLTSPKGEKDGIWGVRSFSGVDPDQEFLEGDEVTLIQKVDYLDYWAVSHPVHGQWLIRAEFFQKLHTI